METTSTPAEDDTTTPEATHPTITPAQALQATQAAQAFQAAQVGQPVPTATTLNPAALNAAALNAAALSEASKKKRMLDAIKRLAAAELRSANAQMEVLLREALARRGALPKDESAGG